jgi:DNA-binding MarR family transcriptional regulator
MSPSDPQDIPNRVRAVRYGVMQLARRMRLERGDDSLSASKLVMLGWLMRGGALTPTELAARERVKPQSLTRTLASLEEDGLIVRMAGASDRRQSPVAITEKGLKALDRDMRQRDAWLAAAMAERLSPTECEILRLAAQLMERLAAPGEES